MYYLLKNLNQTKKLKLYKQKLSIKFLRIIWFFVWCFLFRYTPPPFFNPWRLFLLKLFGAEVDWSSKIYPSVKIFEPWNLKIGKKSLIGSNVDCYNYDKITIGNNSTISQNVFLCTASRNYKSKKFNIITDTITIENNVWIAANCFVAPGITVKKGSVLLAGSNLYKNTKENYIYMGSPAKLKKKRKYK